MLVKSITEEEIYGIGHAQRSKNHTPSRNAKKIGLDRVEQPKILLLPLVWTTLPRPRCFASIWRCWSAWL